MPANPALSWHSLAFLCAFILLVALGWQGKRTQEAVLATNQSVSHSLEIITATQAMLSSLQDIETGSRGFVLTGEPEYLAPYEGGLKQLEAQRRGLQALLKDRAYPDDTWFKELDRSIAERLIIASGNIQERRDAGLQAAVERLKQSGGRQVMDRLRGLLDAVEQRERQQLGEANSAVAQTIERSRLLGLIGSLMVAVLFIAAMWAISRNLRIRQAWAVKAQAGEARMKALLQAIPDNLYAIDKARHVTALSQPSDTRAPGASAIEPLLISLQQDDHSLPLHQTTWCEIGCQRTFEVRLVPTGLGDHLAIARDVSELQRSRDSLEDQKVFLRRVVDTDENLIFVRDEQGCFILCNSAFAALLDSHPAAIEGYRAEALAGAQMLAPLLLGEAELLCGSGELRITEVGLIDRHGQERWLQVVKRPMTMSNGTCHVVTVAVDMSVRRRMEQMKTDFISTVSHELRTPLTAIRGALGMLVGGVAGDVGDSARPLLDIANKNSERLVRLINDILDIEKLEAGRLPFHFTPCEVRPLIEQALVDLKPYADEYTVSLALIADEDHPVNATANIDPDRFAQVMANLLSNAIKHSPIGGVVSIELGCDGKDIEIGIQDQGQGVPESFRSRIFERFAQADSSDARKRGGTGLGLAITRSLVQQMHGRIGFDSREGAGARFWLQLPVASMPHQGAPSTILQPLRPGSPDLPAARILVLEPDAPAAEQLATALQHHGYATLIAGTAVEARKLLAEFSFQALTLSPALNDEDSIAFLQSLRSQSAYRHLPVLIVSLQPQRRDNDDGTLRGGAVGVIDWLHKPVDPSRVMEVVRACLTSSGPRPRILHVEDDDDLRILLAQLVAPLAVDLWGAATLTEARRLLDDQRFDLAIIDLMLPDGDGSELFDQLAQAVPPPPVIIFSALDAPVYDSRLVLRQLVKSRHDGDELALLIQQLLQHWPPGQILDSEEVNA